MLITTPCAANVSYNSTRVTSASWWIHARICGSMSATRERRYPPSFNLVRAPLRSYRALTWYTHRGLTSKRRAIDVEPSPRCSPFNTRSRTSWEYAAIRAPPYRRGTYRRHHRRLNRKCSGLAEVCSIAEELRVPGEIAPTEGLQRVAGDDLRQAIRQLGGGWIKPPPEGILQLADQDRGPYDAVGGDLPSPIPGIERAACRQQSLQEELAIIIAP